MMNRVVIVGRMTRDPELRRTGNGTAVTSFTLALNRNYNSADGQQADFIPVVVWNKAAENVAQYCSKGSLVGVDGRLRSRSNRPLRCRAPRRKQQGAGQKRPPQRRTKRPSEARSTSLRQHILS